MGFASSCFSLHSCINASSFPLHTFCLTSAELLRVAFFPVQRQTRASRVPLPPGSVDVWVAGKFMASWVSKNSKEKENVPTSMFSFYQRWASLLRRMVQLYNHLLNSSLGSESIDFVQAPLLLCCHVSSFLSLCPVCPPCLRALIMTTAEI